MNSRSRSLRSHLTYANVMATVAVFIALGGSSYAAVKLNGKDIKKNTVAGKALKKDTLTGREIKESKLGKVASASTADSALSATFAATAASAAKATAADSVGGATVTAINKVAAQSTPAAKTLLFTVGSMKVEGLCSVADDFPTIRATSSADNGALTTSYSTSGNTDVVVTSDTGLDAGQSNEFDNGPISFTTHYTAAIRNADGTAATMTLNGLKNTGPDGEKCRYTGVAFGL